MENTDIKKKKVLFICTHNSARSQMAEGIMNILYHKEFEAYSAGTDPTKVNSYVIEAMAEIGIDISTHISKGIEEFRGVEFDCVVTVCDQAKETCPFFPDAKKYLHKGFDNPADFIGTEDEIRTRIRQLRDEIRAWFEQTFLGELK